MVATKILPTPPCPLPSLLRAPNLPTTLPQNAATTDLLAMKEMEEVQQAAIHYMQPPAVCPGGFSPPNGGVSFLPLAHDLR